MKITHIFLDLGGVVLTNGWDHDSRHVAMKHFNLENEETEIERRHRLIFDAYEEGKFTLDQYMSHVIFFKSRSFSRQDFQQFMFDQSQPIPDMLALMINLKKKKGVKIFVVSNEGRELTDYRIKKFQLNEWVDAFISSCYVKVRKPDRQIYHYALDISQASLKQVLYIENTPLFVEIAQSLGIPSLLHTDYKSTCEQLARRDLLD